MGALYTLDITNPASFNEDDASSLVVGEWSSVDLKCANVADCTSYLGNTYGTPMTRRLCNGNWAVLFGSGLNSSSDGTGLYIMLVTSDGTTSLYYLDTDYDSSRGPLRTSNENGIAYITPTNPDDDHITNYVYIDGALGNVWHSDLTSQNPAS